VNRWDVERAIRSSGLPANARYLALMLLTFADADTGIIPGRFSPSLTFLATATGLSRRSVATHLTALETAGWITRLRSGRAAQEKIPTRYRVHIPASAVTALVQDVHQPRPGASAGDAPELVQQLHTTSAPVAPNQTLTISQTKRKTRASSAGYDQPGFAAFWDTYPLRRDKAAAAKAYRAAVAKVDDPETLIKAAAAYRDEPGRTGQYTKHPATWLKHECWLDEAPRNLSRADQARAAARRAETKYRGQS